LVCQARNGFQKFLLIARKIEVNARGRLSAHTLSLAKCEQNYIRTASRCESGAETCIGGAFDLSPLLIIDNTSSRLAMFFKRQNGA